MNNPRTRPPVGNHMHEPSGSNILPDEDSGKLHGADSCNSGSTQDRHVVCDETGRVRNRRHLTIRVVKLPGVVSTRRSQVETRQVS